MGLVDLLQQGAAHRVDRAVELLADDVVEDDGAGAQFLLCLCIIREVDTDDFIAGIGIATAIQDVAGENVGLGTGDEIVIGSIAGEHFLVFRHTGGEGIEFFAPLQVFQEDVGSIGCLSAVETVIHRFDGA